MSDAGNIHLQDVPAGGITAKAILGVLRDYHAQDKYRWVFLPEFTPAIGVAPGSGCRIDAWALDCYPSHGHTAVAYEIKASRADFLKELREPDKRRYALHWSNQFYFVAPVGLIAKSELPPECGLKEVGKLPRHMADLALKHTVKAPYRDKPVPTWHLVAAVARRAALKSPENGRD